MSKPKEEMDYFRGETVHEYIGALGEMIMNIDSLEIELLDREQVAILLSDAISILNDY